MTFSSNEAAVSQSSITFTMNTYKFNISSIPSTAVYSAIHRALKCLDGVHRFDFSLDTRTVLVVTSLSPELVLQTIHNATAPFNKFSDDTKIQFPKSHCASQYSSRGAAYRRLGNVFQPR